MPIYCSEESEFDIKNRFKRNEPPGPPFSPISKYIDNDVIFQIALLFVTLLESSLKKDGYVIEKNKKNELIGKFESSINSWGEESNYFFSNISSDEYVRKTFMKSLSVFGKRTVLISDLSALISQVITEIDIPPVKEWIKNEYNPYKKYQRHKRELEHELSKLYNSRSLVHKQCVSSSPL